MTRKIIPKSKKWTKRDIFKINNQSRNYKAQPIESLKGINSVCVRACMRAHTHTHTNYPKLKYSNLNKKTHEDFFNKSYYQGKT